MSACLFTLSNCYLFTTFIAYSLPVCFHFPLTMLVKLPCPMLVNSRKSVILSNYSLTGVLMTGLTGLVLHNDLCVFQCFL